MASSTHQGLKMVHFGFGSTLLAKHTDFGELSIMVQLQKEQIYDGCQINLAFIATLHSQ